MLIFLWSKDVGYVNLKETFLDRSNVEQIMYQRKSCAISQNTMMYVWENANSFLFCMGACFEKEENKDWPVNNNVVKF